MAKKPTMTTSSGSAERDARGLALKFCIEEGNWGLVGDNIQKS